MKEQRPTHDLKSLIFESESEIIKRIETSQDEAYPKVPIIRVEMWVSVSEANFASPKSATCKSENQILMKLTFRFHGQSSG